MPVAQSGAPSIPRALLSPKWNGEAKSYQVADTSSLAAGSQHQLCPRRNCPSNTTDSLEQTALVPPEELLCLTSIPLALCVPGRNKLHRKDRVTDTPLPPPLQSWAQAEPARNLGCPHRGFPHPALLQVPPC